jgi:hypothetical protein
MNGVSCLTTHVYAFNGDDLVTRTIHMYHPIDIKFFCRSETEISNPHFLADGLQFILGNIGNNNAHNNSLRQPLRWTPPRATFDVYNQLQSEQDGPMYRTFSGPSVAACLIAAPFGFACVVAHVHSN